MDEIATARLMNERFQRKDLVAAFRRLEAGDESVIAEFQELIELCDPEIVWDATELDLPDVPMVSHGIEGVIAFFQAWLAAWDDFSWTTSNYEQRGDDVFYDVDLVAEKNGLITELHAGHQMTFREGRLVLWRFRRGRRSGPGT